MKLLYLKLQIVAAALVLANTAVAGEVNVAVAANFTEPMKQIVARFERKTGDTVKLSFGSSGKLYAQIRQGAPFDVFLSADVKKPKLLEDEGGAVSGSRFVYALGKLVLWSKTPGLVDDKGAVLHGSFNKLAYADPKLAPYGMAAQETLEKSGLWGALQGKLVTGESIAQTYQFIESGNAELGFVALSQVIRDGKVTDGSYWVVPDDMYNPIEQGAVLLTSARDKAAARALLDFLKSSEGRAVIRGYGYGLPQ